MTTLDYARFRGVEIVGPLDTILEIVAVILAALVGIRLGVKTGEAATTLIRGAVRFARTQRAPEPAPDPPAWPVDWPLTLSLLVRVDEGEGVLLRPSVQVRGPGEGGRGRVRLELVDADDQVRLTLKRDFPAEALNTELALPHFAPPAGASIDEVLRWRWDIILSGERGELRWREHPAPAGGLNPEAELDHQELAPGEPERRRVGGGAGSDALELAQARRSLALRTRARRLLVAAALIAFVILAYSGPTGQVSAIRALMLYGAFVAIPVALGALGQALFATDEELTSASRS